MRSSDPYDVRVAFDDVYGEDPSSSQDDIVPVFRMVAERIARRRKPPVKLDIVNRTGATPSFAAHLVDPDHFIVGAEAAESLPIFASYYQRFVNALPNTKIVRLEKRVSFLEDALARHVSDGHGENLVGGGEVTMIPLKDAACFRIGREVHCAVKTPAGHFLSTSKSIIPAASEVIDIAGMCGCSVDGFAEELLGCAEYLTGDQIARELRACLPKVSYVRTPLVGVIRSTMDPAVCAAEAMMRRAYGGDDLRQAHHEINTLQACCGMLLDRATSRSR